MFSRESISIHALREEDDWIWCASWGLFLQKISIHALREEDDVCGVGVPVVELDFYPRPPRGGRHAPFRLSECGRYFYPRPPRGGRRPLRPCTAPGWKISIHALREEDDFSYKDIAAHLTISIHALREEDDLCCRGGQTEKIKFLSTPSARRTTLTLSSSSGSCTNFYPRPPRGGRPGKIMFLTQYCVISIHALREEDDFRRTLLLHQGYISIHALREEDDALCGRSGCWP